MKGEEQREGKSGWGRDGTKRCIYINYAKLFIACCVLQGRNTVYQVHTHACTHTFTHAHICTHTTYPHYVYVGTNTKHSPSD